MKLTRDKFTEIHRERQTQAALVAKNSEERLRESGEGERTERRESSDTGGITAAESNTLADYGVLVTRTATNPQCQPPVYLAPISVAA